MTTGNLMHRWGFRFFSDPGKWHRPMAAETQGIIRDLVCRLPSAISSTASSPANVCFGSEANTSPLVAGMGGRRTSLTFVFS
jgi:hypothetical protein